MGKPKDFEVWKIRLCNEKTIRTNIRALTDLEPTILLRLADKEVHIVELILFLAVFCTETNLQGSKVLRAVLSRQQIDRLRLQQTLVKETGDQDFARELEYLLDDS